MKTMTHGSLFSGIGGFDLAAEWMGWENKFHCEWNPFGQKVLHYYWPEAEQFTDITKTNFTKYANKIDILTGGFPCQPYSSAGKRLGKEDERHLWPEMLRAIREIKPRWVVGENVYGLVNWSGGLVFHEVQADLEAEGYEVQPYLLPAAAVNAPHRRDRIWFVANRNSRRLERSTKVGWDGINAEWESESGFVAHSTCTSERTNKLSGIRQKDGEIETEGTQTFYNAIRPNGFEGIITDSNRNGFNECDSEHEINASEGREYAQRDIEQNDIKHTTSIGQKYALENKKLEGRRFRQPNKRNMWHSFPSVSPICDGNDGLSDRLDGITFSKWRQESIKAGGNAIVPQVVYQIFKTIEQYENNLT